MPRSPRIGALVFHQGASRDIRFSRAADTDELR